MPSNYGYTKFLIVQFCLILCARFGWSKYIIPEVHFEAFSPKGLRVSIPDENGLKQFAFHGRLNGELSELEPGEFSKDVGSATNGRWVYDDPNIVLKVGDFIGYWVFVQHNFFGYRKDNLTWRVDELLNIGTSRLPTPCKNSITTVDENRTCTGDIIFEDDFDDLDSSKWLVEKYTPFNDPNHEFCYYTPESVEVKESQLRITPVPKKNEEEIRGILDLQNGCTRNVSSQCFQEHAGAQLLPAVQSGKIRSKISYKYGRLEIDAKLPCGDWIYPEVSLIPIDDDNHWKIYVAYSRGNAVLLSSDNTDIGGKLLFCGFSSDVTEPTRSTHLSSIQNQEPYCQKAHKYKVIWDSDGISSYVDGKFIGKSSHKVDSEYYISLGVSVGGVNDFPNNFVSSNGHKKPWINRDTKQIKNFFTARNNWLPTWSKGSSLIVESVRVYAL